jgi:hypothetical protein
MPEHERSENGVDVEVSRRAHRDLVRLHVRAAHAERLDVVDVQQQRGWTVAAMNVAGAGRHRRTAAMRVNAR